MVRSRVFFRGQHSALGLFMAYARTSRSIPLPSLGTWLIILVTGSAIFWIWQEREASLQTELRPGEREATEALSHLQDMEAVVSEGPTALPALIAELNNSNARKRGNALFVMRRLATQAEPALPRVTELLADPDPRVRALALDVYCSIRSSPQEAIPVAIPLLLDSSALVQEAAHRMLLHVGPDAATALLPLLEGADPVGRLEGVKVLREMGWPPGQQSVEAAVRHLLMANTTHDHALVALIKYGEPTSAELSELLQKRFSPIDAATSAAFEKLVRRGPAAIDNATDLLDLMADKDTQYFYQCTRALRGMGSAANSAVPRIRQLMNSVNPWQRAQLLWLLYDLEADSQKLIPDMVEWLDCNGPSDGHIPFHAGRILLQIDAEEARRQVERLIPRINQPPSTARVNVFEALWGLAPVAEAAIPALNQLTEVEAYQETASLRILRAMGPRAEAGLPIARRVLARPHSNISQAHHRVDVEKQLEAARVVAQLGPAARPLLPELRTALSSPDWLVPLATGSVASDSLLFRSLLVALLSLETSDPACVSVLHTILQGQTHQIHGDTLIALSVLTPEAPELPGAFARWLQNYDTSDRRSVILAIPRLQSDRRVLASLLTLELFDRDPAVRQAAAWTLGNLRAEACGALPALREALIDYRVSQVTRTRGLGSHGDDKYLNLEKSRGTPDVDAQWDRFQDQWLPNVSVGELARGAISLIENSLEPTSE
ncbi:MAG: HEAT repeat domain-containing protein [Planctomycetes bacterium]|nr:HEAT repeat domain-containing protein [Planctomycetota bacterium]